MLTSDVGHPKLKEHFREVLALMRGARDWSEFYDILNRSLPKFNETLQLPFYDTKAMERLSLQNLGPMPDHLKNRKLPSIIEAAMGGLKDDDKAAKCGDLYSPI